MKPLAQLLGEVGGEVVMAAARARDGMRPIISGPNDGRLIFDTQGRMWRTHDFAWWEWRRWLMWLRVCVDGRQRHVMTPGGELLRMERVKGEVEG